MANDFADIFSNVTNIKFEKSELEKNLKKKFEVDLVNTGKKIKTLRTLADKSSVEMAECLSISISTLSKIEHGNTMVSLPILKLFCEAFDLSIEDIVVFKEININGVNDINASYKTDHPEDSLRRSFKWSGKQLNNAYMRLVDLSYADLSKADLSYANLNKTDLRYADLSYADLNHANLSEANLSEADLNHANLSGANLRFANLRKTNLSDANFIYADLSYADLRANNLNIANLIEAKYNDQTKFPDGFDPKKNHMIKN